jgi:hypothetical protein
MDIREKISNRNLVPGKYYNKNKNYILKFKKYTEYNKILDFYSVNLKIEKYYDIHNETPFDMDGDWYVATTKEIQWLEFCHKIKCWTPFKLFKLIKNAHELWM